MAAISSEGFLAKLVSANFSNVEMIAHENMHLKHADVTGVIQYFHYYH